MCPYVTTTRTNLYGHLRGSKHKKQGADYKERDLDEFMRKRDGSSDGKKDNSNGKKDNSNGKKTNSNGNGIKNVPKKSNDIYNVNIVSADEDEQFDGKNYFENNIFLKFVYSEKATKFCKISTLLLSKYNTYRQK